MIWTKNKKTHILYENRSKSSSRSICSTESNEVDYFTDSIGYLGHVIRRSKEGAIDHFTDVVASYISWKRWCPKLRPGTLERVQTIFSQMYENGNNVPWKPREDARKETRTIQFGGSNSS